MAPSTAIDTPVLEDGTAMWRMAISCGLDRNSPYKYLVFCRDFAETSAFARVGGEPAGFVTGYRRSRGDALFVWQIGVLDRFQKRGLARAMLDELFRREGAPSFLEATITPGNTGSWRLFRSFAETHGCTCEESVLFPAELFPDGHEPEMLVRIGPVGAVRDARQEDLTQERSA